jgi:predicted DNA-binding protein
MSNEPIIKIDEDLYNKLKKLSNQIGIPIETLINEELEKFIEIFSETPLDALENIGYDKTIKEMLI